MSVPRISVLMAVYNSEAYVEQACNSVLNQTFSEFELVVLNDGSTDQSSRVLRKIAQKDQRVVLIERENKGLIETRNELIATAQAPLLAWMDSDDIARPMRLERQLRRFESDHELVCLGSLAQEIDPEGWPLGIEHYPAQHEQIVEDMKSGGAMRFPTSMMRTDQVRQLGGFRKPFQMGEDFDLFLRLSESGRMANLQEILLDYRLHPTNTSRRLRHRWPTYRDAILRLAEQRKTGQDTLQRGEALVLQFPAEPPPEDLAWQSRLEWAHQALRYGQYPSARKHAFRALAKHPLRPKAWKMTIRVILVSLGLHWRDKPDPVRSQPPAA